MSIGLEHVSSPQKEDRNWVPLVVGSAVILAVMVAAILSLWHRHGGQEATVVSPINAPLDPYAASLRISNVAMSEAGNLAGGKLTYLDGQIANLGTRTVTGVSVQVLFRDYAHEVAQNETLPLRLIRMRQPYIDVEPVSAAPLKPGGERDFRLIFDTVSPDWDGEYPELRILHVETR